MMKRPRLDRPVCVSLLAIAGLLVLSFFPVSRIRANAGATILPSAGKPPVNLKTAQNVKVTYTGPAAAALQAGTATPTALVAAEKCISSVRCCLPSRSKLAPSSPSPMPFACNSKRWPGAMA